MKKILIVEDEPSFLNLLHKELTSKGYTVVDAKDGKEGYDTAVLVKPDLILLDILMPGVDGLTMLELLRKSKEGKDMKVIILTNLELDNNVMKRALDAKPLYYFVKSDIALSALIEKIDEELMEQEVKELVEEDNEHKGII
ncbi:MAG: response regulator [Candidatus Woesebacteria bacterium]|nr:MAG: response regulator [Candidatus Woesebacteria bacterium]